jgi:cytidylate kinase
MTDKPLLITIDGPAGSGKSTMAQLLAERYALSYLDTGAMFRAAALWLGPEGERLAAETIRSRLEGVGFSLQGIGRQTVLALNGQPVDESIRTEAVAMRASTIAKIPEVRQALKLAQQFIGQDTSLVAEGRDMGSVVFPQADYKFFLEAAPEERAKRRWLQLQGSGSHEDLDTLTEQIRRRDEQDRSRSEAPLVPAHDAIRLDTTNLSQDEVLAAMVQVIGRPGQKQSVR